MTGNCLINGYLTDGQINILIGFSTSSSSFTDGITSTNINSDSTLNTFVGNHLSPYAYPLAYVGVSSASTYQSFTFSFVYTINSNNNNNNNN